MRQRELRKSNRNSLSNDSAENNRGHQLSENDLRQRDGHDSGVSMEQYLRDSLDAQSQTTNEGWEWHEVRPLRQRLLVVANRLPVSAVRRGEEAWSLEISAGGLVSALLGKHSFFFFFLSIFLFLVLQFGDLDVVYWFMFCIFHHYFYMYLH